ncbi:MAG: zinc ribbon domain-containing protein [Planctomycetota bacterium]
MPTYDYVCDACGHSFEAFQSMTAKVIKKCPECGRLKLRRLIGTGAGVIFKGGGFYETDYRSDSYQKDAKADKPAEKKSDSKSADSKSKDTKTAGASASTPSKKAEPSPSAKKTEKN